MTIAIDGTSELSHEDALEAAIAAVLARMGHVVARYPIYLRAPAGCEIVSASVMIDPANLREYFERAIRDWSPDPTIEDKRAAASRFMRRYLGSVVVASLLPVIYGVSFDVAVARIRFLMSTFPGQSNMPMGVVLDLPDEVFGSAERPTPWPIIVTREISLEELRARAVRNLVLDHLQVAFDRVLAAVHVAPNLLWTTVAEVVDILYEGYFEHLDPATTADELARAAADKEAVLMSRELPGVPGPNPLLGLLEWEQIDDPRLPRPVHYRKVCCANFVIPSRPTPYCRSCGLVPSEERARLWKDFLPRLSGPRA